MTLAEPCYSAIGLIRSANHYHDGIRRTSEEQRAHNRYEGSFSIAASRKLWQNNLVVGVGIVYKRGNPISHTHLPMKAWAMLPGPDRATDRRSDDLAEPWILLGRS